MTVFEKMLEALLTILRWDLPSPEIGLEEDGDIWLDWSGKVSVSINKNGGISWAILSPKCHGTDINELHELLTKANNG